MRKLSDKRKAPSRLSAHRAIQLKARGFLLSLMVFAAAQNAAAQGGGAALVDPSSKLYQATGGETVSGTVNVSNPGNSPLNLRLYLSDWNIDLAGQFTISEVGTEDRSASDWIAFDSPTMELAPGESVALPYTVTVPTDAEPGTHWSVLFVESEPSDPVPGQTAATFSVRVGHIVYVNVPGASSEGAVVGVFGQPPAEPGRPYTIIAQYANTGGLAQGVEGEFTVRDQTGERVIEATIERSVVLPGGERAFQINVVGPLPVGNYTALVVLDYGDSEQEVAGAHDFTLTEPLTEPAATTP